VQNRRAKKCALKISQKLFFKKGGDNPVKRNLKFFNIFIGIAPLKNVLNMQKLIFI